MRIFVAGATGAVGQYLVQALVAAGHSVIGTTRSAAKTDLVRRLGAETVVADGLDADSMRAAVIAAKPNAVIHQMTDLAAATDLRHFDRAFKRTNELRTRGTDILLNAAREAGAKRFIAQSFCGWTFSRAGGTVKTETDELDSNPPRELRRTLEAIRYLERIVTASTKPVGIVLRYGFFYGPGTGTLSPAMIDQLRHRRVPVIGDGGGTWSFIHTEDAASATLAALERGRTGSIYNIVDDHPAPVKDWLPALAELLGAKPPRHIPAWLGRLLAGEHMVAMMTEVRGASNGKAKRELGWLPAHASWRDGFADAARQPTSQRSAA
ncbi:MULTISPECIES: NAD-dependent epimerase/dehydratase family protein [unclassified Bradyrhizobium]|uniref:NAD-dependent epimerase/dehydratase family protein n=1 Tax=unclassified Bradyrhizobium TaxID=2631580 RepID=UPI001FF87F47|nr:MULTISPECIES: NAD-dependent epimerase/dehydratase family protein [unclassified Bradyrhizobium]MCK1271144.1 NAD-dependent epimerase/dehydratase family protein [Bradyrhizobium sp. 84]MCK1375463.1 NAD-dependent epimerase/dehydratase family protein [Bradyrhizobium sp. 49]MCK1426819.1 NAD-dependent epimerase/dehydratase family protein [Bradyrhizobium sp. 87]